MRFVCRIVRSLWNLTATSARSTAADVPVKFQSDAIIYTTNLAASRLHEILQWDVLSDIETVPGFRFDSDPITATDGSMISTEKCEFGLDPGLDTGTRHSAEKTMHWIRHWNFLVVGSDISGLKPHEHTDEARNGRSPPGLHGPQKQSQFYKLCNKTITKLLYHRLPTFLRQRIPIFRNIQIHISREIIAKVRRLAQ